MGPQENEESEGGGRGGRARGGGVLSEEQWHENKLKAGSCWVILAMHIFFWLALLLYVKHGATATNEQNR